MLTILVSSDGLAWESESTMPMLAERFKSYSPGSEAELVSINRPEKFALLEAVDTLLMYELGADGPNVKVVRVGRVSDIRAGQQKISFRFKETGRVPRSVVYEFGRLLRTRLQIA